MVHPSGSAILSVFVVFFFSVTGHFALQNTSKLSRDGKVLSLFNIVQFKNEVCRSTSTFNSGGTGATNRNGTCYTLTECSNRRGSAAGSCAAGFGVCCVFFLDTSGATTNQNCSYLRNPGFPNTYADTTQVSYTIRKCSLDVCRLRLDFETFTLLGTGNTQEGDGTAAGGVCLDMFTVTTNTGTTLPIICGQNTGQHIYVEMGCLGTDTVGVNLNFGGVNANRLWDIKVTQIPCNTQGHPRNCGCLQYHTGITGRLTTFNFIPTNDNHLANQEYSICIRQEAGMCCIEYSACSDAFAFSINAGVLANNVANQDTACSASLDYVAIEGATSTCTPDSSSMIFTKFCGNMLTFDPIVKLNRPICDCSKPFRVDIFTNNMADALAGAIGINDDAGKQSRGVCLEYRQIPC